MAYEQNLNRTNAANWRLIFAAIVTVWVAGIMPATAVELDQQQIRLFIDEMVANHQFSDAELTQV